MENIKLGVKLGHGSQAEVFKAKYGLDDVVVKRFLDSTHEDSRRELGIVKQLHNRHIVQFYHVQQDMLVMEYAEGGSLTDAILSGVIVNWDTKTRIAKQVALGLAYLHLLNIIHCDLKSANIVLTMHGDAKICDFGRARMVGQSGGHGGTLPWMAPELFLNPPQYSTKSDVYALGMVMWEMASGCTQPYQEHTHDGVVDCITNGYTEEIPDDTPGAYAACIHECWHQEPEERLAAVDILPDIKIVSPDLNVDDLGSPEDEYDDDLRFISQAVRKGNQDVYSDLGVMCANGKGVKKDCTKAMEWFLKGSDAGDSMAKFNLGNMYRGGHGVEQNYDKAMKWYLEASAGGVARAKFNIGNMYEGSLGVEKDYDKAMEWYLKASDGGCSDADSNIGDMYFSGRGVTQDNGKAMEWWLKASHGGHSKAMFNLGKLYDDGRGVDQNYGKAMEWWLEASFLGVADAKYNIGHLYFHGHGVEQDYSKAMEWYLKASDDGSANSKCNIGTMYAAGQGVEQDYSKAIEWYQKACDGGDCQAMFNMGNIYHSGHGVEQEYFKAMEWYRKASDGGHSTAMFNIGAMYHYGYGMEQNYCMAMEWYFKASEGGHSGAKCNIGTMYCEGQGVEQDYGKAMKWFVDASEGGHSVANFNIGHMYLRGRGVEQDSLSAVRWILKATDGGANFNIGKMYNDGRGMEQDYGRAMLNASRLGVSDVDGGEQVYAMLLSGLSRQAMVERQPPRSSSVPRTWMASAWKWTKARLWRGGPRKATVDPQTP